MQDISKLCMICLSVKDENDICPRCKRNVSVRQEAPLLPLKSIINERYCIAKAMKRNGEGVTYAAYDLQADKPVSVREFFPESIASRSFDELTVVPAAGSESDYSSCRASFIELWTKLMRLKGLSALISVTDVFQSNSTAYAVYEESELVNLNGYLKNTADGYMTWEKARILFMPVLSTLGTLHTSGVIHRGINPRSFVFSKDGKLKLTDFCAEQARTILSDIEPELFDGYTPYEQYSADGNIGPWSDIYSFCAVIYRTLVGKDPIDSKSRAVEDKLMIPAKFAELIPTYVINAMINGMQIMPEDRTQNIEQLRSNLSTVQRSFESSVVTHTADPSKYTPAAPAGDALTPPVSDPVATEDRTDNPVSSYNSYAQRMQGMQPERPAPTPPAPPAAPEEPAYSEPAYNEPVYNEPVSGYSQPVSGFAPRETEPEPVYTRQVNTDYAPMPPQYQEPVQTVQRAPQYAEPARTSTASERVDEYRRAVEEVRRLDEEKRERKKKGLIVLLIFLIILLIGVGLFIAKELFNLNANGGIGRPNETTTAAALVKVPDFKTAKIDVILANETYTRNFTIIQKAQDSDTVAAGTVLDQDIVAGQSVPQGTTIILTVSAGPKMAVVPDDLVGKTYEEAEAALTALGFKCSKSFRQNDGTHTPNTVAETSPLAGSELKAGTLVMVVLWKDVETTTPVIDIAGQPQTTVPPTTLPPTTAAPTEPAPSEEPEPENTQSEEEENGD